MPAALLLCLLTSLFSTASTSAPTTLSLLGNVVVEASYGFPSILALYQLYHPNVSFDIPLQRTEDNVAALLTGQSDFSLIAGPLSAAQAAAHPNLTLLPVLGTAIVPVYRLDELGDSSTPLVFSGRTLALIFAGVIRYWNDSLIAADNPSVRLCATAITVAYQADSRVLNRVFTTALNKYEPSIAAILSPSELPAWPTDRFAASLPGYGLTGVASNVVDNDGSIGFSLQASALTVGATVGWMYTAVGGVIDSDASAVSFAMTELLTVANLTSFADVTLCHSAFCWPIVIVSYLLLDNDHSPRGCAVRQAVVDFWLWYYGNSHSLTQPLLSHLGLSPTPELIIDEEELTALLLSSIQCNGVQAGTPSPTTELSLYGPSRLSFLFDSTDEFFNSGSGDHRLSYVRSESLVALTTARRTLELAALYKDDILAANSTTTTAIDSTDFYLLPTFLTSIVFVYNTNLSTTVDAGNVSLTIDFKALMLIFSGNISDWSDNTHITHHSPARMCCCPGVLSAYRLVFRLLCCVRFVRHHPYLLELNPVLSSLLDSTPAPITLVLACTSVAPSPLLSYLSYYALTYGIVDTISAPYITDTLTNITTLAPFHSCQPTAAAAGGLVYATGEGTISSQVVNLPGAIGYKLDDNVADRVQQFTLLFPTTTIDGHTVRTARPSNPASLLACATPHTFDPLTLNLNTATGNSNPDCYPLTQVVYMQVPHDYPVNQSSSGFVILSALQSLYNSPLIDGWFNNSMFIRATQLPFLQSALTAALNSVTSDGDTLLVTLPRVWVLSSSVQWSGIVIASLGGLCTLLTLCVFVRYRKDPRLRASSPLIMAISLVGIICMYVAVVLLVLTPSTATCSVLGWMSQLGYTLTFAPLLAKAYRIYRIFGRKRLRVLCITDRQLLLFIAVTVSVDAVLLTASSALGGSGPMLPASFTLTLSSDLRQHVYSLCQPAAHTTIVFTVQAILKCGMLVAGVLLAFATRGVSDEFNESKSMSLAVYNLVLVLVLIVPITVVVNAVGDAYVILLLFLVAWVATFTLGVLFIAKLVSFFTSSPHSLTSPVVRRRSQSSGRQQHFSFLSLNHIPSSAALLPYLLALDKHSVDCQRLMARLRQKEGFLTPTSPAKHLSPAVVPHSLPLPGQLRETSIDKGGSQAAVVVCGDDERVAAQLRQQFAVVSAAAAVVAPEQVRLNADTAVAVSVEAAMDDKVAACVFVAVVSGSAGGADGRQ